MIMRLWIVLFLIFLLLVSIEYWSNRPKEKKFLKDAVIHSDVSLLPDGVYEVLFTFDHHMVSVSHTTAPEKFEQIYLVHEDGVPREKNGNLVQHFIKEGKEVS